MNNHSVSRFLNSIMRIMRKRFRSLSKRIPLRTRILFFVLCSFIGLFADEQTFIQRGGFQRYASELNLCVVGADTGPREVKIDDDPDLGPGATYYLDAVTEKWKKNYRMHSYITKELIQVVEKNFPFVQPNIRAISGHSMGGHGALICSFRNPGLYKVATALAPICNPTETRLASKVCPAYLGPDYEEIRKEWDSTFLVKKYKGPPLHVLIDQVRMIFISHSYYKKAQISN